MSTCEYAPANMQRVSMYYVSNNILPHILCFCALPVDMCRDLCIKRTQTSVQRPVIFETWDLWSVLYTLTASSARKKALIRTRALEQHAMEQQEQDLFSLEYEDLFSLGKSNWCKPITTNLLAPLSLSFILSLLIMLPSWKLSFVDPSQASLQLRKPQLRRQPFVHSLLFTKFMRRIVNLSTNWDIITSCDTRWGLY